jgi:hypothetical protein
MRSPRSRLVILAMVLAGPPALLAAEVDSGAPAADVPDASPRVVEQNGVSFTSGGVGREEQRALERIQDRYNLRVTMATRSGEFTSPLDVRIEDASGKPLVATQPDGPVLLARVPAGQYTVRATAEGTTQTRKVSVPANGQAPVIFTWPMSGDSGSRPAAAP